MKCLRRAHNSRPTMSSSLKEITIMQYNTNHSSYKIQTPFLQQMRPEEHHIIAIQEPWINPRTRKTVTHPGYYTILPDYPHPRIAVYVTKEIATTSWEAIFHSGDLATLKIQTEGPTIHIHNCYNPHRPYTDQGLGTLPLIQKAIQDSRGVEHILLGDFNLHHPKWGGNLTQTQHRAADTLIKITEEKRLYLLTEPGTITWENSRSCQTLDLTFSSEPIRESIKHCRIREDLDTGSDHKPIQTTLQIERVKKGPQQVRPQWKKADWKAICTSLQGRLQALTLDPLETKAELDRATQRIQEIIQQTIEQMVPKAKPSSFARITWTAESQRLVKQTRRLRRIWGQDRTEASLQAYLASSKAKGKQIRRDTNLAWRRLITEGTDKEQKIWKIAKWARDKAGQQTALPQFPVMTNSQGEEITTYKGKADLLAGHFFPEPKLADLSDLQGTSYPEPFPISSKVTEEEILGILRRLPPNKAPGPDGIQNTFLKACRYTLAPTLARLFTACLQRQHHPNPFKHSITVALRKPQKPDYTKAGAYRPIALLNTLAKVLEAVVARRISKEAEQRKLLPESQMGARPGRSTLSAIAFVTEQIHTIWENNAKMVASMLCLDMSGAFDNVSHQRLLHHLKMKGFPPTVIGFVQSFLQDRTTCLKLGEYNDQLRPQLTGIPQGSTLSPILFLLFASTLLPMLEEGPTTALGFVDDTNILTFGKTTEENCQRLEAAHAKCLRWAAQHGAAFAPQKYQLIHFTRSRRRHNLQATVDIQGFQEGPVPSLRLLGVWIDTKLQWGPHIKKAAEKGQNQMQSLQRLCKSTWGATFQKARHLYTAIVRPAITYGCPVWTQTEMDRGSATRQTKALEGIQNQALRHITGAYKSVSEQVLQNEAEIPPLALYTQDLARQHAQKTKDLPVTQYIKEKCNQVAWMCRRGRKRTTRTQTWMTRQERLNNLIETQRGQRHQNMRGKGKNDWWLQEQWERRWEQERKRKEQAQPGQEIPAAWNTPRREGGIRLHKGWTRPQSTMATLIRTEHIGLGAYLTKRRVPGATPECSCGYRAQTVKHILIFCHKRQQARERLFREAGTSNWKDLVNTRRGLQAAARWMIHEAVLDQFSLARDEEQERDRREAGGRELVSG